MVFFYISTGDLAWFSPYWMVHCMPGASPSMVVGNDWRMVENGCVGMSEGPGGGGGPGPGGVVPQNTGGGAGGGPPLHGHPDDHHNRDLHQLDVFPPQQVDRVSTT